MFWWLTNWYTKPKQKQEKERQTFYATIESLLDDLATEEAQQIKREAQCQIKKATMNGRCTKH